LKIHGDIRKPRCTTSINDSSGKFAKPVSTTLAENFPPVSNTLVSLIPVVNFVNGTAGVVDTGSK
jgi:hypothetical protein